MGSARYAVAPDAIFVAPTGSDTSPGTLAAPLRSVAAAIAAAGSDQTIILRAGTYHEAVVIPAAKTLTIQPYPNEEVWFDGSSVVDRWVAAGSTWLADWSTRFDASPTFTRGAPDGTSPGWSFLPADNPMAAHPDQVWIDGTPQRQVDSPAAVEPGSFYVDDTSGKLILGSDPTGKTVRASDLQQAILISSPGSTIRGFGIRRYAPSVPDFGAVGVRSPDVTLENIVVTESATIGVSVTAPGAVLRNVTVASSGMLGIHANDADGLLLQRVRVVGNNTEGFNMAPVAGGLKVTLTRSVTIDGGSFSENVGDGIWFDQSVYDMNVVNADLQNNRGHGVQVEISAKYVIANCVITGNGKVGILSRNSNDGRIWNNTLAANAETNIAILQDPRLPTNTDYGSNPSRPFPDPTMTWLTTHVEIKNNVNAAPAAGSTGALQFRDETGRAAGAMGPDVDGNFYSRIDSSTPATQFGWADGTESGRQFSSFDAYRMATGLDQNGRSADGLTALDPQFRLTPQARMVATGSARPMPADIAALLAWTPGTAQLGAAR